MLVLVVAAVGGVWWVKTHKATASSAPIPPIRSASDTVAVSLDRDNAIVLVGQESTPVTVDVYEDFLCPACRQFEQTYAERMQAKAASNAIRVRYHLVNLLDDRSDPPGYSLLAANATSTARRCGGPTRHSRSPAHTATGPRTRSCTSPHSRSQRDIPAFLVARPAPAISASAGTSPMTTGLMESIRRSSTRRHQQLTPPRHASGANTGEYPGPSYWKRNSLITLRLWRSTCRASDLPVPGVGLRSSAECTAQTTAAVLSAFSPCGFDAELAPLPALLLEDVVLRCHVDSALLLGGQRGRVWRLARHLFLAPERRRRDGAQQQAHVQGRSSG